MVSVLVRSIMAKALGLSPRTGAQTMFYHCAKEICQYTCIFENADSQSKQPANQIKAHTGPSSTTPEKSTLVLYVFTCKIPPGLRKVVFRFRLFQM